MRESAPDVSEAGTKNTLHAQEIPSDNFRFQEIKEKGITQQE